MTKHPPPAVSNFLIWRDPLVPAMASGTRLSAAKDRTFKTVRPNQGTGYGRFR